jgi:hypothetical protein
MGSGNANSVFQPHDFGKHFRSSHNGNLPPLGFEDFRIIRLHSRRIDNGIDIIRDIPCLMSFKRNCTESVETLGDLGQCTVGSADFESLIQQYFCDSAHAYPADTDKM